MTFTKQTASRLAEAAKVLLQQGYTWFPGAGEWVKTPGLTLSELPLVPGWFRCAQKKPGARDITSWDGYTFVTKQGVILHFSLSLHERKWSPSIGYEDRVCFVPISICEEIRLELTPG